MQSPKHAKGDAENAKRDTKIIPRDNPKGVYKDKQNFISNIPVRGQIRPVRVKRSQDQETLVTTSPVPPTKPKEISSEVTQPRKRSKIAVLTPGAKSEHNVESHDKLIEDTEKGFTKKDRSVSKHTTERHIHFSDEQEHYKPKRNENEATNSDRKKNLKEKRELFRFSKSSCNSEHVSDEISPDSETKTNKSTKSKFNEEIPLKELGKTSDSSTKTVHPQSIIKTQDQRSRRQITHVIDRSKVDDTHFNPVDSKATNIRHRGEHVNRVTQSPRENRNNKLDSKVERGILRQPSGPKQYLSPDVTSPNIEKSKSQQRLQNQSSTETSGLGDTITSGFSSQESIASFHSYQTSAKTLTEIPSQEIYQEDLGIDLSEDTTGSKKGDNDTYETKTIDLENVINGKSEPGNYCENIKSRFINKTGQIHVPSGNSRDIDLKQREFWDKPISYRPMKEPSDQHKIRFLGPTDQLNNNGTGEKRGSQPNASTELGYLDPESTFHIVTDFDELFQQSENLPPQQTGMGLGLEQINNEWNRHTRSASIKSIRSNRSSQGSFRSRSGSTRRSRRFLGEKESKWMKWGRERRASFRRRLDKLEQPEPEVQPRPSTPIKKARQEGLMFIHPDLESKYISEEDINYIQRHRQQRLQTYKVIEKSKNVRLYHAGAELSRLTANDLNILTRFWEHRVFVRSRYISILLSFVNVVFYIISICSSYWIYYPSEDVYNEEAHEGLWYGCRPDYTGENQIDEVCDQSAQRGSETSYSLREQACEPTDSNDTATTCLDTLPNLENVAIGLMIFSAAFGFVAAVLAVLDWQNAVIGLMIFSAAFGFVAAVLAVLGVCTSPLPKKIYYFHSAGEIFFVCALSTTVALIIYPVAIAMDTKIHSHTFGSGYRLGWGGAAFFYAASFCMSLDELVRESAQNKCCRYICWRTRDRGEQQQV